MQNASYNQQRSSSGMQRMSFPPEDPPTYQEVSDEEDGYEVVPGMGPAGTEAAISSRRQAVLANVEARMQRIGLSPRSDTGASMALLGAEEDDWGKRSQARRSNTSSLSSRQSPPISPLTDQVKQMQQYLRSQNDGRRVSQESRMMQQPQQHHQSILQNHLQQPGEERAAAAHHHQQQQQYRTEEDIQRQREQLRLDEARARMEDEQRRMQERERQRLAEAETRMLQEQNAKHR
jgi:hypothetical protein